MRRGFVDRPRKAAGGSGQGLGLLHCFPLLENGAAPAIDVVDGVRGTVVVGSTAPSSVLHRHGRARYFSSLGQSNIDIVSPFAFAALTAKKISLTCWSSIPVAGGASDGFIFGLSNTGTVNLLCHIGLAGTNAFRSILRASDGTGQSSSATSGGFNDGTEHFLALVVTPSKSQFYVDGRLIGTLSTPAAAMTANVLTIGALHRTTIGSYMEGSVRDARIYNTILTAQQINRMFASPHGVYGSAFNHRPRSNLY